MQEVNHPLKFIVIGSAAFLATCLCFYLMMLMLVHEFDRDIELEPAPFISPSVTEKKQLEQVAVREKPKKVLPMDPPPEPDGIPLSRASRVDLKAERPTFGSIADLLGPNDVELELKAPTSDLMPMLVVQPTYPLAAVIKEQEGFVVVEFSVRENGTVSNPVVIDSFPEHIFDDAALHAVTRFKFKPREINGDSVAVDGVQLKFAFTLDSAYDVPEEARQ